MLFALTTEQKFGLAGTAAVFIAFSLLAAFLLPRANPDFPGRRGLVPFILVTLILMIAMLGAVEVFAKEEHSEAAAHETAPEPGPPPSPPTPGPQQPPPPMETAPEEPAGSPEAGRAVFESQGCGSCHAFSAAGTSGTTGPNLDESLDGKDAAYVSRAIVDPDADVAQGYGAGVMPKTYEEQLSPKQLDDLVAFLTSG